MPADPADGPDRPIILLGCPRSGTTMLQLMLHRHPRIAIPPENRFVIPGYQSRSQFGDLHEEVNRRALADWICRRKGSRFHDLKLDADEVAAQIIAGPPTLGSAFGIVFRAYAAKEGKPRWGDKRPAYSRYVGDVLRLFPDAQIVHLVRDGRDCVASLLEMPWWKGGVDGAVCTWAQTMDDMRRAKRQLPPDTFYELHYEALVAEPERELRALCTFLGERYDDAMKEPSAAAPTAVPQRKDWHRRTHEQVNTARVGGWSTRLAAEHLQLCEAALGSRLRAYGYELSGAPRPSWAARRRYAVVCARRRAAVLNYRLTERSRRLRERRPVAAQLTSRQRASADRSAGRAP